MEGYYFRVSDKIDQAKYRVFGAKENPFLTSAVAVQFVAKTAPHVIVYLPGTNSHEGESILTADNLGPSPMVLPTTKPLQDSLQPGVGDEPGPVPEAFDHCVGDAPFDHPGRFQRAPHDEPRSPLLLPLCIGPFAFRDPGWAIKSIQVVECVASACHGGLILLENGLHIGNCN